jgi:putative CocE/NonD family hydrolase
LKVRGAALASILALSALPFSAVEAQVASPENCGGTGGGASQVSEPGPYEIGAADVVELESDLDGGIIQIGFIRPDVPAGVRTPVIVDAGSYYYADLRGADLETCNPFLIENFVQHGYTVAFVPTRGAAATDRCADLMGAAERGDLDQAVTWLGEQPWSNGKVGMTGISYHGSTPWEVASMGNPYLETIVPASGVVDLYSQIYRSGRADSRWWFFLPGYQTYYNTAFANPTNGRDPMRWAQAAMCESVVEGMAATMETYITGEGDGFDYWIERNSRPGVEKKYKGSIFVVQGMQDHNVPPMQPIPWVNKLKRKGTPVKMMLGQWGHAWPDTDGNGEGTLRWDYADILLRWWDRWLMGEGVATGPRVEVQDSSGKWRASESWPPDDADDTKLYLTPGSGLLASPEDEEARTTLGPGPNSRYVYVSDVAVVNDSPMDPYCAACAVFTTEAQEEDLRLSGIPSLDLTVVPHGPGGTVSAYIYSVDADDAYHLLGYGSADLRFPRGGHTAHPVTPGDEIEFDFNIEPLDGVVPKGSRLVLLLDQGNAYDMPGPLAFPVDLVYGGKRSSFTFPVVTPDPGSYFTPPPQP